MIFAGLIGTPSLAAPIPLPDWVRPIESSLPGVPPEVISEVDDIYSFFQSSKERYGLESEAKIDSRSRRLVELQEQGEQAKIWQYLKNTNGIYSDQILFRLGANRNLAAWLLPIVRFRVEWLKQFAHDPGREKYIKDIFQGGEIDDIAYYFYQQGEFSDIENLNILVNEAIKLKFTSKFKPSDQKKLQAQVKVMQEARNWPWLETEPGWKLAARSLIKKGVLTADALKPRPSGDESNRPKPLGPRQPLPEIRLKTLPGFVQPWMMGPMWLLILVVSAGLLRWVFRKPGRAPHHGGLNYAGEK